MDCVKTLLQHRANLDVVDNANLNALFYAARAHQAETINLLIQSGANLSHKMDQDWDVLDWVFAQSSNAGKVQRLRILPRTTINSN